MTRPLTGYFRTRGLWWVRFFGVGVRWKRVAQHPLLFSERVLNHGFAFNGWHFRFLAGGR